MYDQCLSNEAIRQPGMPGCLVGGISTEPRLGVPKPTLGVPMPRFGVPKPRLAVPRLRLGVCKPRLGRVCPIDSLNRVSQVKPPR